MPFSSTGAEIASALEDVSIPTLVLSLVHITGDLSLIRDRWRPAGLFLNEIQGFMTEQDKADVRAHALGCSPTTATEDVRNRRRCPLRRSTR
ncbi:MAG: hypothetical protein V9G12_17625 [Microthrixaceae bacterium]